MLQCVRIVRLVRRQKKTIRRYTPAAIGNRFRDLAMSEGIPIDPMKVQKLVYFAHGWHLGFGKGPLSIDEVQAWRWGPVFPNLYHAVKIWGTGPIMEPIGGPEVHNGKSRLGKPNVPADMGYADRLTQRVWEVYGPMPTISLSQLTHEVDGPRDVIWKKAPGRHGLVIPDPLIRDYFAKKAKDNRANAGVA